MDIKEKVAYLKGLMEGMKFDDSTNEGKVVASVVDILGDMAKELNNLSEDVNTLNDYADELDHDLGDLEEAVYNDECDCCHHDDDDYDYEDEDDEDYDDEDDEDDDDDDDDDVSNFVEIKCPNCGDTVFVDSSLEGHDIQCPNCNGIIKGEK